MIEIRHQDAFDLLQSLAEGSVDLLLTDPPYGISRDSNFATLKGRPNPRRTHFGEWDTTPDYYGLALHAHKVLRGGGTAIVWCSWQVISHLYEAMTAVGFNMCRMIVWEKTNPWPTNHKTTYLSTAREVAIMAVKGKKPIFHSEYDRGVYELPSATKKQHPTQKPLQLFLNLVYKHSALNALVCDPYLGSGTTAWAAALAERRFVGGDYDPKYVAIAQKHIDDLELQRELL